MTTTPALAAGLCAMLLAACSSLPPAAAPAAPGADPGPALRTALGGDWEAHYFDAVVDLDGDGAREVVALVAGPMVCGTGGCPLFILAPTSDGYRVVSQISVVRPPVRVSTQRTLGWRNLVVGVGGGGAAAGNAELKFNGTGYPVNPTVPPAGPADLERTEVLVPEFGSYRDGKRLPPAAR